MVPVKKIDLYQAVQEMSSISRAGGTFSFRFRKWDRSRLSGGGIASVDKARIRPKASDEEIAFASHKLFFTDTETGEAKNCWIPLIVEFNGMQTVLN